MKRKSFLKIYCVLFLLADFIICIGQSQNGVFSDLRDGHVYKWVKISNQIWMAENLAFLPAVSPSAVESLTAPFYYVYNYQGTDTAAAKATVNYATYGALYNWPAAMNGSVSSNNNPSGVEGVCPSGWHLPSEPEWIELIENMGGESVAANKLKESGNSHWIGSNDADNSSGFTGLPSGLRGYTGNFQFIGYYDLFWTASDSNDTYKWYRSMYAGNGAFPHYVGYKDYGFSVRCVKDEDIVASNKINISFEATGEFDSTLKDNQLIGLVKIETDKKISNVKIEGAINNQPLQLHLESIDLNNDNAIDQINSSATFYVTSKEMDSNVINKDFYLRISSINGISTNFIYQDTISMYFAKCKEEGNRPFKYYQDTYQFTNPGPMSLNELTDELVKNGIIGSPLLLLIKDLNDINGRCFGMAASIGSYFCYPYIKPEIGYPWDWGSNPSNAVLSNITAFHFSQTMYNFVLNYENPNNIYENIRTEIENSNPVILNLMNSKKIIGNKHAVLATKITEHKNGIQRKIYIYDSNMQGQVLISENKSSNTFDTYNVYDKIAYYPQKAFIINDPIVAINYFEGHLPEYLNYVKRKIFASGCPVNMYITDQEGKRSGYLPDGMLINEIPNTEVFKIPSYNYIGDSITYIYSPDNYNYEVKMHCFDAGKVRFEYYEPSSSDQLKTSLIDSVYIESGNVLLFYDKDPFEIFNDKDGDGTKDLTLNTIVSGFIPSYIQTQELMNLRLFPNPTHNRLNIEYDIHQDEKLEFEIFNSLGQMVMRSKFDQNNKNWIDISNLSDGIYYINFLSINGLDRCTVFIKE